MHLTVNTVSTTTMTQGVTSWVVSPNGITFNADGSLNTARYSDKVKATAARFKQSNL